MSSIAKKENNVQGLSAIGVKRLSKELKDYTRDAKIYEDTFSLSPIYDIDGNVNLSSWTAVLKGPKCSPYEGGKFTLDIKMPSDFPIFPPTVKIQTQIFHPNFNEYGAICIDILKRETGAWNPTFSLPKIILAISSLMNDPNADDPLNASAASLYKHNRDEFNARAQEVNKNAKSN
jgi:ubiquitin-conjugating enzyme E2 D/E